MKNLLIKNLLRKFVFMLIKELIIFVKFWHNFKQKKQLKAAKTRAKSGKKETITGQGRPWIGQRWPNGRVPYEFDNNFGRIFKLTVNTLEYGPVRPRPYNLKYWYSTHEESICFSESRNQTVLKLF